MSIQQQAQRAIQTLHQAFAPMQCLIAAQSRKGSFSFTLLDAQGVARRSERLYPEHFADQQRLQAVIERTRQSLRA